jgi:hypothetical protein
LASRKLAGRSIAVEISFLGLSNESGAMYCSSRVAIPDCLGPFRRQPGTIGRARNGEGLPSDKEHQFFAPAQGLCFPKHFTKKILTEKRGLESNRTGSTRESREVQTQSTNYEDNKQRPF